MNELQRRPVVVMNFSGIYRWEPFALDKRLTHIDCSDISGTDGYCTREAAEKINKRIAKLGPEGIHFIDNGNYHYVTKLWTNMIRSLSVLFSSIIIRTCNPRRSPACYRAGRGCVRC